MISEQVIKLDPEIRFSHFVQNEYNSEIPEQSPLQMFEVLLARENTGELFSLCPVIPLLGTIITQKNYSKLMLSIKKLKKSM